ncbi:LysR family transcriptional regulator [Buttiauxella sp. B2]|uniref:LysR family transcriptional regulator n=1 Tax=Buttiauxella sp. B2 TaxID=2587812 RepID=UPI001120C5D2|nr:LysR family transcriptional regulator [Buttiauxella sp. B2]TNV19578.1 LysR family transcriptional regulator [Buttiauxella sp. B2]
MTEPDLNLLIALDVLLAEGSVVGAAHRLGLSASAMSRTLSRLRATVGDPLLVRAGRNMVLTPYAEEIRERAQNAAFEARAILRPSSHALNLATLERSFTLRTNAGFIEIFGAALIAAVAVVAPLVQLRFMPKPEKTAKYLREGLIDLEVGVLGEMGPEIRLTALYRDRFVGVVRKGHSLEQDGEITPEKYAALGHVVVSRHERGTGPVDVLLSELNLTRKIAAMVPGFPAALAVAQASDLVALVPGTFLLNQPGMNGNSGEARLHVFELPVKTNEITVSLMWHPRSEVDPAHRWLRQLVMKVCRERVPG